MGEFSTERPAASSWIAESKPQENEREKVRRARRKPSPKSGRDQDKENTSDPERPTHQIDRLA
jgi:hypothetical protein